MLTSKLILQAIDKIAATASKNEKQAMVTSFAKDDDFKRVLEYAYNPFKTYGMRQIPEPRVSEFGGSDCDACFDDQTWKLLDDMIARRLTGNDARDAVKSELERLDSESADLLVRIIRKDLRAGFSESTCNKAVKGLIPEFPYMRCSLPKDADIAKWPWESGVISQEKADGMFANLDHEIGGLVSIRSRQGTEFPIDKFPYVVADVRGLLTPGYQQHGEFLVLRDGKILPRAESNGVMNHVISGGDFAENERPIYFVWDQIPLEAVVPKGKCSAPYRARLSGIIHQLRGSGFGSVQLIPTRIVRSMRDAYAHAAELMKSGKEGTVIKHPFATWKDGTSKEQIKLKLEFEVDLKVESIVPGRVGTKNEGRAGSLSCRTSCGKLLVDVAVKNEAMRDYVDSNPEDWIGRVIVVVANDVLEPSESNEFHSLFLPRMVEAGFRTDKTTADDLERVIASKEAAILGEAILKEAA